MTPCPADPKLPACSSEAEILAAYNAWVDGFTYTGGCGEITDNKASIPTLSTFYECGDILRFTYRVEDDVRIASCTGTFTLQTAPILTTTCPTDPNLPSCSSDADVLSAYNAWVAGFTVTNGCGPITDNRASIPELSTLRDCGGVLRFTLRASDNCSSASCSGTFTLQTADIVTTCPTDPNLVSCSSDAEILSAYNTWVAGFSYTGGCSPITDNIASIPALSTLDDCGGVLRFTLMASDNCSSASCSGTFTLQTANIVAMCPTDPNLASCSSDAEILSAYNTWVDGFTSEGGCGPITNNKASIPALSTLDDCGGMLSFIFIASDSCSSASCSRTFTVQPPPPVEVTPLTDISVGSCQTQQAVNAAYAAWIGELNITGGCNLESNIVNPGAPAACGGSATVTWAPTSTCTTTPSGSATFTVLEPAVEVAPLTDISIASCQTQQAVNAAYATWIGGLSITGGCNLASNIVNPGPPAACGGSTTVTWAPTSSCITTSSGSATFTVIAQEVEVVPLTDISIGSCQTQQAVDAAYASWIGGLSITGGCNLAPNIVNPGAPSACGGSTTVTWAPTSSCTTTPSGSATFTVLVQEVEVVPLTDISIGSCQTQQAVDAAYATWIGGLSITGGCNLVRNIVNPGAPSACGGSTTVTWAPTSSCTTTPSGSATFTVLVQEVEVVPLTDISIGSCQTQQAVDAAYATWIGGLSITGGCNLAPNIVNPGAPAACGGSATVTWAPTSTCTSTPSGSATFTVLAQEVEVVPLTDISIGSCQTQQAVDVAYATWIGGLSITGGCNLAPNIVNPGAPAACGGSTTVIWAPTSSCTTTSSGSATFTVLAQEVEVVPLTDISIGSCQTQQAVDAAYATWIGGLSITGGCNLAPNIVNPGAPAACGGSTTVTWAPTSSCITTSSGSATFTVIAPVVEVVPLTDISIGSCQTQQAVDAAYASWLGGLSITGGCNLASNIVNPEAPAACGGSTTVTWAPTSSCTTTSSGSATFTVIAAEVEVIPLTDISIGSCQTQQAVDAAYATWIGGLSITGGCNLASNIVNPGAPAACGGSTTVTWAPTSLCTTTSSGSATFTVQTTPAGEVVPLIDLSIGSCQTQQAVDLAYAAWIGGLSITGGCNLTPNVVSPGAPAFCGGSSTVMWNGISSCEVPITGSATFTVSSRPDLICSVPSNQTIDACEVSDSHFETWLDGFRIEAGCNRVDSFYVSIDGLEEHGYEGVLPDISTPNICGGSLKIRVVSTDDCAQSTSCESVYQINNRPVVVLCPDDLEIPTTPISVDSIRILFADWLKGFGSSGGDCGPIMESDLPDPSTQIFTLGQTITVEFIAKDRCSADTCSAKFELPDSLADMNIVGPGPLCTGHAGFNYSILPTFDAFDVNWYYTGTGGIVIDHNSQIAEFGFTSDATEGGYVVAEIMNGISALRDSVPVSFADPLTCDIRCNGILSIDSFMIMDPGKPYGYKYQAELRINSDGKVPYERDIMFQAGESIVLEPGFEVDTGSVFRAVIDFCDLVGFKEEEYDEYLKKQVQKETSLQIEK